MSLGAGVVHVLHPGDVVCAERGDRLETLLGSCVAVVLTDPRRTIGAMCHIVHASAPASGAVDNAAHAGPAIDRMYRELMARAIQPRLCVAYVYGGGNMFPQLVRQAGHVGERNAEAVVARLRRDGVHIVHVDVGGRAYRRLSWAVGPAAPTVTAVEV
jgi:chemotaxis protein CheD